MFTRQNPFVADPPMGKAHYNPTHTQKLSKQQKKTTLSPVRLAKPSSPPSPQTHYLSPEDQRFLGAANNFVRCPPLATDTQPSFSESWPSTDLGSSPANAESSLTVEALTQYKAAGLDPTGRGDGEKYIERFRHDRPQSGEERQMGARAGEGEQPFRWLSPSPLPSSSTPTQTADKESILRIDHTVTTLSPVDHSHHGTTLSPFTQFLDLSALDISDCSHGELGDPEVLQLQERASKLLRRSENSHSSSSVPISSEGLGCSDFSSPVSVEESVRRPMIHSLTDLITVNSRTASVHVNPVPKSTGVSANRTRPEEDILFQWRLRRKMESARMWPQSISQQSFTSHHAAWLGHKGILPADPTHRVSPHLTPTTQETRIAHGACNPANVSSHTPSLPISSPTVSKLLSNGPVPGHMHPLCDVLPCPARPTPPPLPQKNPQRYEVSGTNCAPIQLSGQACTEDTTTDEPTSKHEFSPPPASSETTEEDWVVRQRSPEWKNKEASQRKPGQKTEKQPGTSCRKKKKKTARYPGTDGDHNERPIYTDKSLAEVHQRRRSDRVKAWREEGSRNGGLQERGQDVTTQMLAREGRPGDCAPPPSPIHSALGQVISGVLFPTPDSPPGPRTPVSLDSLSYTPPAPPQSPAPPTSMQPPTEVISKLLQEAEDSDEKEFEDDPLLQVLRKQRTWVKDQISEVDSLLEDLQGQ